MGFIKRPHTCLQLIAHWVKYSLSFNTGMIDFFYLTQQCKQSSGIVVDFDLKINFLKAKL